MFRQYPKTILTSLAIASLALAGCSAAEEKTEQVAQGASSSANSQASASPTSAPASSQESQQGQRFPAVEDSCPECTVADLLQVEHPQYGPMTVEIKTWDAKPGSSPHSLGVYYALYQGDALIGMVSGTNPDDVETTGQSWGFGPEVMNPQGMKKWSTATGTYVDNQGHVFFGSGDGKVVILTPTENGYDSKGTLPNGEDKRFNNHSVQIDAEGNATLVPMMNVDGTPTYVFKNGEWVQS